MIQIKRKKIVVFEENALKEYNQFSNNIKFEFEILFAKLELYGQLKEPDSKKLYNGLFELRINHQGAWRAIYAYYLNNQIMILSCFRKKTQKTPKKILKLCLKRLQRS